MSLIGKKILSVLNNSSKGQEDRGQSKPFDQAESIAILYTWEGATKEKGIEDFRSKIEEGRTVKILCFNPDKKNIVETKHPLVSVEELSILGRLKSSVASDFLGNSYDYLFHLDFDLNEITQAILINSKAKYRVGLHTSESEDLYELMIGINRSAGLDNLIEQMLVYVNALK